MAGAIAGTALLNLAKKENGLEIVTMTVNNDCNYGACPHCYLQYSGNHSFISDEIVERVLEANFLHLAIVGKEPLFNSEHAQKTEDIARRALKYGKTTSIITNGMNLNLLSNPENFAFIDVSFDGGPRTYGRQGDYGRITGNVKRAYKWGAKVNALHTLFSENIGNITDMVRINNDACFNTVLFSPYLKTKNEGYNYVNPISLEKLLGVMSENNEFMDAKNTLLNLDLYHAKQQNMAVDCVRELVQRRGLEDKTILFDSDLSRRVARVTYDGFIMAPQDSLNPAEYRKMMKLDGNLSEAHKVLLN